MIPSLDTLKPIATFIVPFDEQDCVDFTDKYMAELDISEAWECKEGSD